MPITWQDEVRKFLVDQFKLNRKKVNAIIKGVTKRHPGASDDVLFNATIKTAYDRLL